MLSNSAISSVIQALDPAASVFVSANAGAGKTSLLTSRVLRLLLHGAPPSKILCLTFTNAAAAEMMSRVQAELGKWVMGSDAEVSAALEKLTDGKPDMKMLTRARSLFATVLEAPEGIRIQTIHGFCQSLLRRFPVEAGISPHFTVMDGRTEQELLREARLRLFNHARGHDALQESLHAMVKHAGESGVHALFGEIIQHKRRFRLLLSQPGGVEAAIDKLWQCLKLPKSATLQSLIEEHFSYDNNTLQALRQIAQLLIAGKGKTDGRTGQGLAMWLSQPDRRTEMSESYAQLFLTEKNTRRTVLYTKNTLTDGGLITCLLAEQDRVAAFHNDARALEIARMSTRLLRFSRELLSIYATLKQAHGLMDYDDLILAARDLLQKEKMTQWVLFKLDGGIDHILVDEAQDTSPEQWSIIDALTAEFYAGEGRRDTERSLFIVGDEKQSIFSFQGANPSELKRMQRYFSKAITDAAKPVRTMALTHSYRSTKEVLAAVDAIFAQPAARAGLMFDDSELAHIPTRLAHPGLVEVWPLVTLPSPGGRLEGGHSCSADESSASEQASPHPNPPPMGEGISPHTRLARSIADTIRGWIDNGTAEAGDIMILVRSRTVLVDRLVRALKRRGVPVAGRDRMLLNDNLAVKDLIALGRCLLLPEDDLTLASVLKSPIFNISEEDLFALAYERGDKSLWEQLSVIARSEATKQPSSLQLSGLLRPLHGLAMTNAFALLAELRAKADFIAPHELYSRLLDTKGARRRFIGRMGEETQDPIDEFLNQALLYERSHPPSLQGFLHWLDAGDSEIKRDMEQARNAVRIMTVHGAKGLQAPIVILPDTVEIPKMSDRLLWQQDGEQALPLWPLSSDRHDTFCASLHDRHKQAMLAEYRRLLYVALTRAEDRLYICGATRKEEAGEQSWYHLIKTGLSPLAEEFKAAWGRGLRLAKLPLPPGEGRGEGVATGAALTRRFAPPSPGGRGDFFFLDQPAPAEPLPPKPLSPSHLTDDSPAAASPLSAANIYQRGSLIHKLLQYLPEVPVTERERIARRMAGGYRQTMPEETIAQCVREALAVIDAPQFTFLFGKGSLAEVPVAGCVDINGKPVAIAGQIDRLFIGDKTVWIIDFKSNHIPPERAADIPAAYLKQLALYRRLVQRIYQEKFVRCALVWTAVPRIDKIGDALLDEALSGS